MAENIDLVKNKKYLSQIVKHTKGTESAAYDAMMAAVKKHKITKDEYVKEQFYLLDAAKLNRLFTTNSVRARVEYVAEKYKAPKGLVYTKILDAYAEYKIPIQYFVANELYKNTSEDCLSFHRAKIAETREHHIQEMISITGWDRETVEQYVKDTVKKHGVGLVYILDNELFKRTDEEIAEIIKEGNDEEATRSKRIKEEMGWSDYEYERHRVTCRYRYRIHEIKTYDNLKCWKRSFDELDTFACPRDAFILKDMYDTASTEVLDNKTLFDQTFKDFLNRKFWVNRDTSLEEFKEFIKGLDAVFCKPINLNGGHGSYRYNLDKSPEEMYEYFMNEPMMLIEEVIKQHHLLNEIYPGCINSIRIMSILKDGEYNCFGAWIKFGANGSQVDGRVQGGSFAGVDEKTGIVVTTAIDGKNNRFSHHPNTGARIQGFQIPYWKEILALTEKALRHVNGIDFVGWDVAITENGPVIVEGNSKPALADYQLLFADDFGGMKKQYDHLLPPAGAPGNQTNTSGWLTVNGKRYYYKYGFLLKGGWLKLADGKYYLAADGHMLKNGWLAREGKKFYLAPDGRAMCDAWVTVDGQEYYLNSNGAMLTGWQIIDDKKYYLGTDGARRTGWHTIGGHLYFFDANGVMRIS